MGTLKGELGKAFGRTVDERLPNTQKQMRKLDPWNPSAKWCAYVKNPLPVPTTCRYCQSDVCIINNSEIYGRSFGDWPWAYRCSKKECGAYVGMHPKTNIPLGTLADQRTRDARKEAKDWFNPIWQDGLMTRTQAYHWLAEQLGITKVEECHIGWFDEDMCERVKVACGPKLEELLDRDLLKP